MTPMVLPGPVGSLAARTRVPPSKSLTNRALVAAAVAGGGQVEDPLDCDDTRRLALALSGCGWELSWQGRVDVGARRMPSSTVRVDLGDSATGARLILGLIAAVPGRFVVDGSPRLRQRPMGPLLDALTRLGARVSSRDGALPVTVEGGELAGGHLVLSPGVSSQFVSALLLAAPLMARGLDLELVGAIPSRPYLDLTEETLERFGGAVESDRDGRRWRVMPQALVPTTVRVEGDWSAAAFFLAAAAVAGGWVEVSPLERDSRQGDRRLCEILTGAGVEVSWGASSLRARGPVARPIVADLEDTPDLFPALAVVAALAPAGSVLTGLAHLRHKESDRLAGMVDNLRRLGAVIAADGSSFRVLAPAGEPVGREILLTAGGDHRVAMAAAVAALRLGPLFLDDPACVSKSFPGFWEQWGTLAP